MLRGHCLLSETVTPCVQSSVLTNTVQRILFSVLGRPSLYARTRSNEPNKRSFITLHVNDDGNTFSFRNMYIKCHQTMRMCNTMFL